MKSARIGKSELAVAFARAAGSVNFGSPEERSGRFIHATRLADLEQLWTRAIAKPNEAPRKATKAEGRR